MPSIRTVSFLVAIACSSSAAFAEGALDFADPCTDAEKKFNSTSDALRSHADTMIAQWDSQTEPPGELRPLYVEAIRTAAYQAWITDPSIGKLIETLKTADPSFDAMSFFLTKVYPQVFTQEKESEYVRQLYKADYETKLRPQLISDRQGLEQKISEQKDSLNQSCKPDVFNQVFRSSVGRLLLVASANSEAAKNEKGDIAKGIRLVSGVSITDIEKNGILGGDGSELRKIANAVTGGESSELSKALREIDKTLNPANWKVELPEIKIELPSAPKIDPPTITLPGGTRVCLPWC